MEVKFGEPAAKAKYRKDYYGDSSAAWLFKDNQTAFEWSFWLFQLNPFRYVSVKRIKSESFIDKLRHVVSVFIGTSSISPAEDSEFFVYLYMPDRASIPEAWDYFCCKLMKNKPGILDYCLLFLPKILFTFQVWISAQAPQDNVPTSGAESSTEEQPAEGITFKPWMALVLRAPFILLFILLSIGKLIVGFVLTLALSPVVLLVHVFLGPKAEDGSTPLRQSVFFNPSTWILGSILLAAIGLLIQGLNPAVFAQAAVTMGIMQTVLLGMAAVTLVGGLLYTIGYAAYERFKRVEYVQVDYEAIDGTLFDDELLKPKADLNPEADVYPNPLKYLSERWKTISNNPGVFLLIWGIGLSVLVAVIGFTIGYFTGGMVVDLPIAHIFDFMNQAFFAIVHALAGLSGLGFLSGISGPTLVLVGHILSAVLLSAAAFFITDNVSRMVETIMPKAPSPEEEITFDNPTKGTSSAVTKENNQLEHYDSLLTQSVKGVPEQPPPYTTDRDMFWCCALGGRKIFSVIEACDSEMATSGKIHLEAGTYVYIHPGRLSSSAITGLIRGTEKKGEIKSLRESEKACEIESNNLAEVLMPENYLMDCDKKRSAGM